MLAFTILTSSVYVRTTLQLAQLCSHTTLQLAQLCQNLGIILIALYPNATRILQPADVAAFRPIKVMWRKAVLEWRTDNLTKSLLKTDVAPILEKLLPKLNKTTLKNGFEACGLCPFNPDQVDYTKCLMPSKPVQENLDDNCSISLNYQTFEEIVGPQLIRKMKNQVVGKSMEAKKLHDLYKYLVPKISTQEPSSQIIETTSVELIQHQYRSNLNEQNNCGSEDLNPTLALNELTTMPTEVEQLLNKPELSTHEPQSEDTGTSETNKMVVDYSRTSGHEIPLHVELQQQVVEKLPLSPGIILSSINDSVPEVEQTVDVISEYERENQSITPINLIHIPSTSRQSVELIGGKWVLVDDMPTEVPTQTPIKTQNIKDFLKLPKTPIKTQKANIEHRSFVLTSKDWEAVELEKQQKKMKEIQEKENKRIERLEKAKEKRLLKEKKQAETLSKKNKAKNLNLIKKSKPNPDSIKPNIVIQSNVLIKPANRISSDIEEERRYTREIKEEPMNQAKPANMTALKEIKNRPIVDAVEAVNEGVFIESEQVQMAKKELKKGPILGELKPVNFSDSRETGKDKKIKVKENRLRPITNEELLRMLEED